MKEFSGQLDMGFMIRPGSVNIELLCHGHVMEGGSYILPVLEGANFEKECIEDPILINGWSFIKVRSKFVKSEFYIPEGGNTSGFLCNKMIVDAEDVEKAVILWTHLGFRSVAGNKQWAHLKFKGFGRNGSFDLFIRRKDARSRQFYLDQQGFNCLAFISTDAERERKRFEKLNIETSEINRFRVNGKDLSICWLRGAFGEIIEVISLA
jgi:hypothetical protein